MSDREWFVKVNGLSGRLDTLRRGLESHEEICRDLGIECRAKDRSS